MFLIKKFDLLSPPITLFFKGEPQHPSIPSVILSIISYSLVLVATIYYFLGFINKDSPKAYFFTRYIEDAGYFPVNASSMFNYIQFIDKYDNTKLGFDFSVLRAVGVNSIYYDQYMNNPEAIETENHWIYGPCNSDSDIKGIEDLIDYTIYNNAACIREYYDKDKNKYFKTGEKGFVWPVVQKGCSNPQKTFYGLIVQRCDKAPNRLMRDYLGPCETEDNITEAIKNLSLRYQIIDHYADMLNYNKPFIKYFYEVTSAVQNGIYIVNHLNFNPANMLTHNGLFFDNIIEENSYFFTQNEKHTIDQSVLTEDQSTNGCLIGIYFWMQNTLQQYERHYDRIQDILSSIGGIGSIITTVAYYLNLLINYYITLLDTEELIINRDEVNFGDKRKNVNRPTVLRRVNEIKNPPKRQIKPRTHIHSSIKENDESNKHEFINNDSKPDKINMHNNYKLDIYNNYKLMSHNKSDRSNININTIKKNSMEKIQENNSNDDTFVEEDYKEDEKRSEKMSQKSSVNKEELPIKKQNFSWCKYILYLISFKTNDKMISYFEDLRAHLISEENIFQSYLDIYNLMKVNDIPKKDIFISKK